MSPQRRMTSRERIAQAATEIGWTTHSNTLLTTEYRRGSRHVCLYFSGIGSVIQASHTRGSISGTNKAAKVIAVLEAGR